MACVRKRRGKWTIDFYDQFGKRHWETIGTNKKDAEEKLASRLLDVGKGSYHPEAKYKTFGEIAESWIQTQLEPSRRPRTTEYYRSLLDNHILPRFKQVRIGHLDLAAIEVYMAKKLKEGSIGKNSINKSVTTIGTIMKFAVRHKFIDFNPVSNVQKLRHGPEEMEEEISRILNPEEVKKLINEGNPQNGPLIRTTVFTGMRESELLGLKWPDIDWQNGQIHIVRTLQRGKFYGPKTKSSKRKIDIDPSLLSELRKWKLRCPKGEFDLVFPNSRGLPMDPSNLLKRIFYPALIKAKVDRIRFHDLRHTNVALRIEAGQNLKYIQTQLGHSSIQVTMDIYGHLLRDTNQDAAIRLNEIIFNGNESLESGKIAMVANQ